jgi:hypothetical protein
MRSAWDSVMSGAVEPCGFGAVALVTTKTTKTA